MTGHLQLAWNGIETTAAMLPLQPPAASSIAGDIDQLYYLLSW